MKFNSFKHCLYISNRIYSRYILCRHMMGVLLELLYMLVALEMIESPSAPVY
jgi:hypothetical protein